MTQTYRVISRYRLRLAATLCGIGLACAAALSEPALAGYEEGMEAFSRGDYATAFDELRPLADKGDPNAQFTLGFMYDYGQGVRRNAIEAIWWYRKAAEQGSAVAQFTLGGIYESGRGAPKDLIAAYRWYSLAAESLPPGEIRTTVMERQNLVAAQLSESELTHARELLLGQAAAGDSDASSMKSQRSGPEGPVDRDLLARIQAELARLGYHTGRADGVMNESTRGAILAFEIESGREPEGTPTEALLDALIAVESTTLPLVTASTGGDAGPEATQPPEVASGPEQTDEGAEATQTALTEEPAETSLATTDEPVDTTPETASPSATQEASIGTDDADSEAPIAEPADRPSENPEAVEQLAALHTEPDTAAVPRETDGETVAEPAAETPEPEPEPQLESEFVRAIQSELKRLGYDVGPIDGLAGRQTVTAIRSFEVAEHLPVTGVLSEELLAQLRATEPPQSQLSEESTDFEPAGEAESVADTSAPAEATEEQATTEAVVETSRSDETTTASGSDQPPANPSVPDEVPAAAETAVIEQTAAAGDVPSAPAGIADPATQSPLEQAVADNGTSTSAASQGPQSADRQSADLQSVEPAANANLPATEVPQATAQTTAPAASDQTAVSVEEPFEAPALELRLTEPQLAPSQPPELDANQAGPIAEARAPSVEAPEPPGVGLQAPTPLVGPAAINGQATDGQATGGQPSVPQPPAAEATTQVSGRAPTPLVPAAQNTVTQGRATHSPITQGPITQDPATQTATAQPASAEPVEPGATNPESAAEAVQQQTAALTARPSPNETRETETGSTEPKPDLNAAAKRRVLNKQLARLGEITAQVDSPSAAVPGWSKLEAWETETANVLSSRFGPKTANGLLAKRQELVLGDPFGNFKRTTDAYRLYLNGLKKDL